MSLSLMPFEKYPAPALEELNTAFVDLTFVELVSVDRMGAVYKAVQNKLDRVVTARILPSKYSYDEAFLKDFCAEAKLLGKLNHCNLVTVFDFGVVSDMVYLLTEYVGGTSMHECMNGGVFSYEDTLKYTRQIASALSYAHSKKVAHKALRARNVLFDAHCNVKLVDFSFEHLSSTKETMLDLSDMRYAAPESLVEGAQLDVRSDIYSLGVLMMKCMVGMFPMEYAQVGAPYRHLLGDLYSVIYRCIRTRPENRYQSMNEVIEELDAIESDLRHKRVG